MGQGHRGSGTWKRENVGLGSRMDEEQETLYLWPTDIADRAQGDFKDGLKRHPPLYQYHMWCMDRVT